MLSESMELPRVKHFLASLEERDGCGGLRVWEQFLTAVGSSDPVLFGLEEFSQEIMVAMRRQKLTSEQELRMRQWLKGNRKDGRQASVTMTVEKPLSGGKMTTMVRIKADPLGASQVHLHSQNGMWNAFVFGLTVTPFQLQEVEWRQQEDGSIILG